MPTESNRRMSVEFDYFSPDFRANPYAAYARLREQAPVCWGIGFEPGMPGVWHIARYADIQRILKDPRFTHQHARETHSGVADLSPQPPPLKGGGARATARRTTRRSSSASSRVSRCSSSTHRRIPGCARW